jgi:predicted PurR-regulated permease PerM
MASVALLSVGGSVLAAALVFAWGAAVMLLGDNFVQPRLIGGSIRLPFLWTFIGIFGGVQTFGLIGLFLGPTIMTGVMTIWREWIDAARGQPGARQPTPVRPGQGWPGQSDPANLSP